MTNGFFGLRFLFFGGWLTLLFCFSSCLRSFSSSIFRRPSSIAPKLRCSAGARDGNEVFDRDWAIAHWIGCKFIKMVLDVFLFRNDDGNSLQHSWELLDALGNIQNNVSSASVRLTHVDTPYCWKCACGARAKLIRWELWINTVIDILKSLRKVPVHGKQNLSLGRTF